jgi:AcrR family transcriptional regulator
MEPHRQERVPVPKQVDHEQRREEIAAAVCRLAATRGLQGVSFRQVASEAGVSVALVQHYFGTKEKLVARTLEIQSAEMGRRILARLASLGTDASPLESVKAVAIAFLPSDDDSRDVMLLYHGFAAAALTDGSLRNSEAFANERNLRAVITDQLTAAKEAGQVASRIDPTTQARAIVSMILGLSLTVLLGGASAGEAEEVLDAHLRLLESTTEDAPVA